MQQGQRQVVENLLKARFGELDEQLAGIIELMLQLPPQEYFPYCWSYPTRNYWNGLVVN